MAPGWWRSLKTAESTLRLIQEVIGARILSRTSIGLRSPLRRTEHIWFCRCVTPAEFITRRIQGLYIHQRIQELRGYRIASQTCFGARLRHLRMAENW